MTPQLGQYASQFFGHPFGLGENGKRTDGLHTEIPFLSYTSKLVDVHDSLTNGEPMGDRDIARIQSILPLGTVAFMNTLFGMMRTQLSSE